MVTQAAQPMRVGGLTVTQHQLLRGVASLCGLVALVLFYQPWVEASLNAAGNTSLTGIEMARGDAARRVNEAVFGAGRNAQQAGGAAATGATGGAVSIPGGVVLPTRIPTVAAGTSSTGFGTSAGAAPAQPTAATSVQAASAVVPGGIVLPTRIPTVAPGTSSGSGFGTTAGAAAQQTPLAPASTAVAPAPSPPAPTVLPSFWLHAIPLAALGLATVPLVWGRFTEQRDRSYGRAWTLLLSYGGSLFLGYVLWRIVTAPETNVLLGPGVGSVRSVLPALWGAFTAFVGAAVCLMVVWLLPAPPPPDPYGRVRTTA